MKKLSLLLFLFSFFGFYSKSYCAADTGTSDQDVIRTSIDSGDFSKARKAIEQWQNKDHKSPQPWVYLAEVEFHEKNLKRTISAAQKALDRDPTFSEAFYWKGMALSGQGKHLEAINELKAAQKGPSPYIPAAKAQENIEAKLNFSAQQK